eukprot:1042528-Prorocentrum_minimum.AAC.1
MVACGQRRLLLEKDAEQLPPSVVAHRVHDALRADRVLHSHPELHSHRLRAHQLRLPLHLGVVLEVAGAEAK